MKQISIKFLSLFVVSFFSLPGMLHAQEHPPASQISKFSGEPVPRFASLRYSAVHGRQGPSLDHAILWRYEAKGMPVLILRETHGWRWVRDKDGDEVWVQARMLSNARTAVLVRETVLRQKPGLEEAGRATLKPGVVVELALCQSGWCRVEAGKRKGWISESALWGTRFGTDGV